MRTSSAFIKGTSHIRCDDYAIDLPQGVIVCDGCSGSKGGNFASRFVATIIGRALAGKSILASLPKEEIVSTIRDFFPDIDQKGIEFLDTTLLSIILDESGMLLLTMLGDGHIFIKYRDGNMKLLSSRFTENYPMYVSYLFDDRMREQFITSTQYLITSDEIRDSDNNILSLVETKTINTYQQFVLIEDPEAVELAAIFTDGLDTYRCHSPFELAKLLTDIKVPAPNFAQRRLDSAHSDLDIGLPTDDLGMGVVIL